MLLKALEVSRQRDMVDAGDLQAGWGVRGISWAVFCFCFCFCFGKNTYLPIIIWKLGGEQG